MDFWVSEMHTNNVKISIRVEQQLLVHRVNSKGLIFLKHRNLEKC